MKDSDHITSKLEKLGSENPFKAPEGYFDDLHARISDKIHSENAIPWYKRIFVTAKLKPVYLAAIILSFVVAITLFNLVDFNKTADRITEAEIAEVILNDIYHYDEELIIESFEETSPVLKNHDESEEAIIDYLIDEGIDVPTIIEEL